MELNRKQAPALHKISEINIPTIEKLKLDNGIPLWIINTGSQELIKVQISLPAGTIYQNKSLVAFFTNRLLREGSKNYSAAEIAELFDFYGAFLDTKVARDRAYINVFCLTKHLNSVLIILTDILQQPLLPENELQVLVDQEKQAYAIRMQKVKSIAHRKFNQAIFGADHKYGSSANTEDYDQINSKVLMEFFKENYSVNAWHIFVSGKLEKDSISIINEHLGAIEKSKKDTNIPIISSPVKLEKGIQTFEHADAMQTSLKMGKLSIGRTHKDYPILSLTQTILGGFFGSRLMQNIREDKGYTYGIHSSINHLQHAAVFSISSEFGTQYAQKAHQEVLKELKLLRTEEVKPEELELVKNYMAGGLLKSLNGPFALGDMMRMLFEYDLSIDYFKDFMEKIQAAKSNEIIEIANKYLHEEEMLTIMVGTGF